MKIISIICFASVLAQSFAQNKKLQGTWMEYKREVLGDTNTFKYTVDGRAFHPSLLLTISDDECVYTEVSKTSLFSLETFSDTIKLMGFEKQIFSKTYTYRHPNRKTLVLTEAGTNDSTVYQRKYYLRKTHIYPAKDQSTYIIHQAKDVFPMFPGGTDALEKFFKVHQKKIPALDSTQYHQVVQVMLTLNESGKIINADIIGNPWKSLAEESLRLIKLMPNWEMGPQSEVYISHQKGIPKRVYTFYPIEILFKSNL